MQSRQTDLRTDAAEYVLFFFVSLFAWSEVATLFFLIFGKRATLKGFVLEIGSFSICWLLGYFPFRSIWEKLPGKLRANHLNNAHSSPGDSPASMVASEVPNEAESETAPELPIPVPGEDVYDTL